MCTPMLTQLQASVFTAVTCEPRCKRQLTPDPELRDKQAKRARVDKAAPRKHERFWLADGNAVIELDGASIVDREAFKTDCNHPFR